jgi:O-antigen/teichoic acid export membrane protein
MPTLISTGDATLEKPVRGTSSAFSGVLRTVVEQSAWLMGANVVTRVLGAARGIAVAKLLAPEDYGLLATLTIAAFYLQTLELGVGWGTIREIPLLQGQGKTDQVLVLERSVLRWELAVSLVAGVAVALFIVWTMPIVREPRLAVWLIVPVYVVGELLRNTLQTYLQCKGELRRLRLSMIVQAILDLTLGVILTWWWGLAGAATALALTSFSVAGYLMWDRQQVRHDFMGAIPWGNLRALMSVGFPLMVQNLMWTNMTTIDKVVILSFLDRERLAYYAIAQTIAVSTLLIPGAVTRVNGPLMIRRFAASGDPAAIHGMVYRTVMAMAYGLPVIVASTWLAGPTFFQLVLPAYKPAVPLLDLVSVGMYAIGVTFAVSTLYTTLGKQLLATLLLVGSIGSTAVASVALIRLGFGVAGVAGGFTLSSCLYLATFLWIGFRMLRRRGRALVGDLASTLLPVALCTVFWLLLANLPRQAGVPRIWVAVAIFLTTAGVAALGIHKSLKPVPAC